MNDNPHFGVVPIDNPTLPSGQDKVNNIKGYGFSGSRNYREIMRRRFTQWRELAAAQPAI